MNKYSIDIRSYNVRRYGKPWIARVSFAANAKGDFTFGDWVGTAGDGGTLVIAAAEGDIVATGQKDNRGGNSSSDWHQVRGGTLVPLSGGKVEAYKLATTGGPVADVFGLKDRTRDDLQALLIAVQAELASR